MAFELRGPRDFDRTVDAGTPWRLFGSGGNTLPNGSYTLTARAYAEAGGTGDALSVTTATFTVTGSYAADAAAVTGFTLVDAAGGLPDPDLGALADAATVDLSATGGWASVRAELAARRPDVKGVVLALRGPRKADRAAPAPASLFGAAGGDYVAGAFPDGAYTLTARPLVWSATRSYGFAGGAAGWTEYDSGWSAANGVYRAGGGGKSKVVLDGFEAADVLVETDVRVTSGGGTAGVIFRVSDPRHGRNAFRGYYAGVGSNSPLVLARMDDGRWQELGSAALYYERGRWYRLRVVAVGSAIGVHVDGALVLEVEDDTHASGSVGLERGYAAAEWDNVTIRRLDGDPAAALPATTVAFTVTGGVPRVVTGFTLIDAGGPAPDVDVMAIADGATLSFAALETDEQSVRAELVEPGLAGQRAVGTAGPGVGDAHGGRRPPPAVRGRRRRRLRRRAAGRDLHADGAAVHRGRGRRRRAAGDDGDVHGDGQPTAADAGDGIHADRCGGRAAGPGHRPACGGRHGVPARLRPGRVQHPGRCRRSHGDRQHPAAALRTGDGGSDRAQRRVAVYRVRR